MNLKINKVIIFLFGFIGFSVNAHEVDSLLTVLSKTKNTSEKIILLDQIIDIYTSHKPNLTEKYIDELYAISKDSKNEAGMATAYFWYANIYSKKDLEKSDLYLKKSKELFLKQKNTLGLIKITRQEGSNGIYKGNYETAMKLLQEAVKKSVEMKDRKQEAVALSQIGLLFFYTQRYEDGLSYTRQALEILHKIGAKRYESRVLLNMGVFYLNLNQYDESALYIEKFFEIQKELKDLSISASGYANLAEVYQYNKQFQKAESNFKNAFRTFEELQDTSGMSNVLRLQLVFYKNIGDHEKSLNYSLKNIELIRDKNIPDILKGDIYYYTHEAYKELGKYQEALEAFEKATGYRQKAVNVESNAALSDLKEKYETEKKEQENKELRQINEINQLKIKNNRYLLIGVGLLSILIIVAFVLIIHNNKIKAREKNLQIQQKLLVSQMNPHFIFNSLNSIQNFIYKQDAQNAAIYLNRFSELMRMILTFSRKDRIALAEEKQLLERYLDIQKLRFGEKLEWDISIEEEIDEENVLIQPMLAQPFIENSLEHGLFKTDETGKISIHFKKENNYLIFEIEDNGIGLNKTEQKSGKHESLATIITSERIAGIKTLSGKNTTFDIINLREIDPDKQGVKVIFKIPYETVL